MLVYLINDTFYGGTTTNTATSIRLAPADNKDLKLLVNNGLYSNASDAGRDAIRRGIREIKKERGIVADGSGCCL